MTNERQERAARAEAMRKEREKADKRQRNLITVGIVVVVVALIVGASVAISKTSKDNALATKLTAPKNTTKDYGIEYTPEDVGGKTTSKTVKVTMYEDFQCPACKAFEAADSAFLKQALAAGDISFDWRPISFLDANSGKLTDNYSHRALNTALCVLDTTDVKTYAKLHDTLYVEQSPESGPGLTDATLNGLAKQAGAEDISQCLKTQKFTPWIDKATTAFGKAGYQSTPTVVIDGKEVKSAAGGSPSIADLQKAIAAAKG